MNTPTRPLKGTTMTTGNIDVDGGDCRALGDVLSRIGDKWTVFVVGLAVAGAHALQ